MPWKFDSTFVTFDSTLCTFDGFCPTVFNLVAEVVRFNESLPRAAIFQPTRAESALFVPTVKKTGGYQVSLAENAQFGKQVATTEKF